MNKMKGVLSMNVTIIPNDPGCKPVKPGCPVPPANGIAGYDDTVTDFITASPDMGVVLRTDTKVAKLHKGIPHQQSPS